jgi:hypothetical protein
VTVTYHGPRPVPVRLYASRSGTGLDQYLKLTVTRGRARSTPDGRCTAFKRDALVFRGRLAAFPSTYEAAARRRPQGAWKNGESHTFRFRVRLVSTNAAQGQSVNFAFFWQART